MLQAHQLHLSMQDVSHKLPVQSRLLDPPTPQFKLNWSLTALGTSTAIAVPYPCLIHSSLLYQKSVSSASKERQIKEDKSIVGFAQHRNRWLLFHPFSYTRQLHEHKLSVAFLAQYFREVIVNRQWWSLILLLSPLFKVCVVFILYTNFNITVF